MSAELRETRWRLLARELGIWLGEHGSPLPLAFGLLWRYLVYLLLAVLLVGPFLWLFSISIRGAGSIYEIAILPKKITLRSYLEVWREFELWRNFVNSVIVAVAVVILNLLLSALAGYPLARYHFRGKQFVFFAILSTMMIPFQLYMIPLYLLCLQLGMGNTFAGLILPMSVGALGIFLLRQYFLTIPTELEEAARVDGAGELRIWWTIMVPLAKPALATLAIFIFVFNWSNFLWPLIILSDQQKYTLPVAIAKLIGVFMDKTSYLAAGSVISILPVIVVFLFLQRYFIRGIIMGAIK